MKTKITLYIIFFLAAMFFASGAEAFGVPNVYYSVGQTTSDLKTGSPTVTITGGAAVFSVAQTGNIGVGDRVTYNTNVVAYIAAKTNADMTQWALVTATGGTPANITDSTVVSITREYTSLSAAEAGAADSTHLNSADLTTANVVLNLPCYYDTGADTAAVTIDGYTTDATRYIKVYTPNNTTSEVNMSQRHNGKWDETKWQLEISNGNPIIISDDYVRVEGVQIELIHNTSAGSFNALSTSSLTNGANSIMISHSVISAIISGSGNGHTRAINIPWNSYTNAKIWNNIIYDFNDSVNLLGQGINYNNNSGNTTYIYNNTFYNCYQAIVRSDGTLVLKNNVVQNSRNDGYVGTFDASSNYNISDLASDAPGANSKNSTTVRFVDAANKDFHLHSLDTSALNAGADLSADANLPFNTDIDGHTRATLSTWDIGADEATTAIYRSVGVGATSPIASGTNNAMMITGSTAVFDQPLPDNVGVGDALQYDSDNDGSNTIDSIAFIHERLSSTRYIIKKADGTAPTATTNSSIGETDWAIYRAYISLANAETGTENTGIADTLENFDTWSGGKDLTTNNEQWNIAAYMGTGADTTALDVNGWTTEEHNFIKIYTPVSLAEVGVSQRHQGKWDANKYALSLDSGGAIQTRTKVVKYEGLQIRSGDSYGIRVAYDTTRNKKLYVGNNIINSYGQGVGQNSELSGTAYVYNNIIYGVTAVGNVGVYFTSDTSKAYVYNNTIITNTFGITGGSTLSAKNNLIKSTSSDFSGSFHADSDYNASDDLTAPGSHSRLSQTFTFVDETNKDFHLKSTDAGAKNVGADLTTDSYIPIITDIDGNGRPTGASTWDIGADERNVNVYYSVSGGGSTADNKTAATIQISSGVMIFSAAQTGNIGMGDEVVYGAGTKAYISGKIDTSNWYVTTATGDQPADVAAGTTLTSIKRTWGSLSLAEAGATGASYLNNTDLVASGVTLNFPCYYDTGADTTAVTIDGYTTGANNYIKVYTPNNTSTEANNAQRHSGKWDEGKYRLELTADNNSLTIKNAYTRIEGLQVKTTTYANTWRIGIYIFGSGVNYVRVNNNIVKDGNSNMANRRGVGEQAISSAPNYIFNNVIYDFSGSGSEGIHIDTDNGTPPSYVYNNTVYNCAVGISTQSNDTLAKNNIAQNCTDGFLGTFINASDFNISNVAADAPGANSKNSTTVSFVDAANKDFHLAYTDTVARDSGADLRYDVNLPITDDIDNNSRAFVSNSLTFAIPDIGADEGATAIYRSVSPSIAAVLANGATNALNISSSTATFATALPDNVGVGDVLEYDDDNDGDIDKNDSIAFIVGRTDSTHYTIKDRWGNAPTIPSGADEIHWNINRSHTSLSNAEAGTESTVIDSDLRTFDPWSGGKNIAATNEQWNIAAYANGTTADTATVTINGWTTALTNYIRIYTPIAASEVGTGQRHQGKWDTSKYRLEITNGSNVIRIDEEYVIIDGLQINSINTGATWPVGIYIPFNNINSEVKISNNIMKGTFSGLTNYGYGIATVSANSSVAKIWNNILYNYTGGSGGTDWGIYCGGDSGVSKTWYIYNNTIYNSETAFRGFGDSTSCVAKNNIAYNNTDNYSGTFNAFSTNNLSGPSSDAQIPATGAQNGVTVTFADESNNDFHLAASDIAARNTGAALTSDQYLPISTDIDGHSRQTSSHTGAWDIGADEGATAVYYSVGQNSATDHKVASTVTVSGNTLTFQNAQTDAQMGVGDKVTYDTSKICYITGKTSTTVWSCLKADGTAPDAATDATVNSITNVFSNLNNAVNTTTATDASEILGTADLFANNYQLNIPCFYDTGADTTAATVDGWTTGAPNYIKIYTPNNTTSEVNQSQRHQGKWDDGKYKMALGSVANNLYDNHIVVEGLQIHTSGSALFYYVNPPMGELKVLNNILKGTGSAGLGIYYAFGGGGKGIIANNIIYDMGHSWGGISLNGSPVYVYNNTVINSARGIAVLDGQIYAKNNIVKGSGDTNTYVGVFASGTDYNATDGTDAIGQGSNNRVSQTFSFVDEVNKDYHLSPFDTSARNTGTSLASDSYYAFTSDIDGNTRNIDSRGWDIGADEAATSVYYSVGQSSSDLKTGSPTVDISNGLATFSTAQTGNIGVGDVITYNTTEKAYIVSKTDTSNWTVQAATGASITGVSGATVDSIKHVYTSLSGAEAGASDSSHLNTTDLHTNNYQLNIPCYYDSDPDTTAVTIDGWTTAPTNYIKVYTPNNTTSEANVNQRHNGKWNATKYRLEVAGQSYLFKIMSSNVRVEGLQAKFTSSGSRVLGLTNTALGNNYIGNNIFNGNGQAAYGVEILSSSGVANIYNNIVYDTTGSAANRGIICWSAVTCFIYNNTIKNVPVSLSGYGIAAGGGGTFYVKNNIVQNATTADYNGTYISSSNNLSSDATSPNSGSTDCGGHSCRSQAVAFTDAANKDFHLAPTDTAARNSGADLSADANLAVTSDIDGNTRATLGTFDIGADEGATAIYRSVAPDADGNMEAIDTGSADSNSLTISGSTATFSIAVPDNVGVGDALQYDDDGDSDIDANDSIVLITGRTDSQHYTVKTAAGDTPTAVSGDTDWSIFRAYTSLYNAERGTENTGIDSDLRNFDTWNNSRDIFTNNEQWNISVYANGTTEDTVSEGSLSIGGWTTSPSNYIKIYTPYLSSEVGVSQRHRGTWDDSKYHYTSLLNQNGIGVLVDYARIEGLQVKVVGTDTVGRTGIYFTPSTNQGVIHIANNIVKAEITAGTNLKTGINASLVSDRAIAYVYNNIVYGFKDASNDGNNCFYFRDGTTYAYNNTAYECDRAFYRLNATATIKNSIAQNSEDGYSGTFSAISTNNITDLNATDGVFGASADSGTTSGSSANKLIQSGKNFTSTVKVGMIVKDSGSNYSYVTAIDSDTQLSLNNDIMSSSEAYTIYTNRYGNVVFMNENSSDYDFHLAPSDTLAKGNGINLSADSYLSFNTDIDGDARGFEWSIGADEGGKATVQTPPTVDTDLDINNGLVLYQSFDGEHMDWSATTSEARDQSGQNNNGDIIGATAALGKKGQGTSFDGISSYIKINDFNEVGNSNKEISVFAWVQGAAQAYKAIASHYDGGVNQRAWQMSSGNTSNSKFQVNISDDGTSNSGHMKAYQSSITAFDNNWHYVGFTFNNGILNLYIDGVLDPNPSKGNDDAITTVHNSSAFLTIASWLNSGTPEKFLNGKIDEVRVYNRVLSEAEITQLYNQDKQTINASQAGKMTNSLGGHWTFDGADVNMSTNQASDSSGNSNTGTIAGATQSIGKKGQALSFDGSSGYVTVTRTSSLDWTTSGTIAAWFKTDGDKGASYTAGIAGKCSTGGQANYAIKLGSSGYHFIVRQSSRTYVSNSDPSQNYADGRWHHMAGVANSATGKLYVYVDGELQSGTTQDYDGTIANEALNIFLGNGYDNVIFDGSLDDIRVYSRALSADEIGDLYRMGSATIEE